VDLLINQLKIAIRDLLEKKGIRARVLDKVNARGEIVIGVIIEKEQSRYSARCRVRSAVGSQELKEYT
jgi:hypothetical protein